MAILVRAPGTYSSLLESALNRAGIPAFFSQGTRRPDPSGRAFLSILACAAERVSARRFAEYLSFAQVPDLDESGASRDDGAVWCPPEDEMLGPAADPTPFSRLAPNDAPEQKAEIDTDDNPALSGALRAPWQWEKLLVEAAVIGGKERWVKRLKGLDSELRLKLEAMAKEEPESARILALERNLKNLHHLRNFSLPVIDMLGALPSKATWGEWLDVLQRLAPLVLRRPERVLALLAELEPMATVGPTTLDQVRNVLTPRLSTLDKSPQRYRYGQIFVATPEQARGHSFDVDSFPGSPSGFFRSGLRGPDPAGQTSGRARFHRL